jgi:hypothetical protein
MDLQQPAVRQMKWVGDFIRLEVTSRCTLRKKRLNVGHQSSRARAHRRGVSTIRRFIQDA